MDPYTTAMSTSEERLLPAQPTIQNTLYGSIHNCHVNIRTETTASPTNDTERAIWIHYTTAMSTSEERLLPAQPTIQNALYGSTTQLPCQHQNRDYCQPNQRYRTRYMDPYTTAMSTSEERLLPAQPTIQNALYGSIHNCHVNIRRETTASPTNDTEHAIWIHTQLPCQHQKRDYCQPNQRYRTRYMDPLHNCHVNIRRETTASPTNDTERAIWIHYTTAMSTSEERLLPAQPTIQNALYGSTTQPQCQHQKRDYCQPNQRYRTGYMDPLHNRNVNIRRETTASPTNDTEHAIWIHYTTAMSTSEERLLPAQPTIQNALYGSTTQPQCQHQKRDYCQPNQRYRTRYMDPLHNCHVNIRRETTASPTNDTERAIWIHYTTAMSTSEERLLPAQPTIQNTLYGSTTQLPCQHQKRDYCQPNQRYRTRYMDPLHNRNVNIRRETTASPTNDTEHAIWIHYTTAMSTSEERLLPAQPTIQNALYGSTTQLPCQHQKRDYCQPNQRYRTRYMDPLHNCHVNIRRETTASPTNDTERAIWIHYTTAMSTSEERLLPAQPTIQNTLYGSTTQLPCQHQKRDYCQPNQRYRTRYMDPLHNCHDNIRTETTASPTNDTERAIWIHTQLPCQHQKRDYCQPNQRYRTRYMDPLHNCHDNIRTETTASPTNDTEHAIWIHYTTAMTASEQRLLPAQPTIQNALYGSTTQLPCQHQNRDYCQPNQRYRTRYMDPLHNCHVSIRTETTASPTNDTERAIWIHYTTAMSTSEERLLPAQPTIQNALYGSTTQLPYQHQKRDYCQPNQRYRTRYMDPYTTAITT